MKMNIKTLFCAALMGITLCTAACSGKDENPGDPAGTITLNMMNESNGKTLLGTSGIYINNANNFYGNCLISFLGKKSGLGAVSTPVLQGLADEIAVKPGHAFQVFNDNFLSRFPSGATAAQVGSFYYNVYVVSEIKKGDEIAGATVKYVLNDVPQYGLPEYGSDLGRVNNPYEDLEIDLSTSDFEWILEDNYDQIECEKHGRKLIVSLKEYKYQADFKIFIRIRESYTYVYGSVW